MTAYLYEDNINLPRVFKSHQSFVITSIYFLINEDMTFPQNKLKQAQTSSKNSYSSNLKNKDISRASNKCMFVSLLVAFLALKFYSNDVFRR